MDNSNIDLTELEKKKLLKIRERLVNNLDIFMESSEEQIKMSLVLPFFDILGYDTMDVTTFKSETGLDKNRVDYLINVGESTILVECKKLANKLTKKEINQLSTYFSSCRDKNKLGVLTNGDKYLFFRPGVQSQNHMELEPFVTIEISKLTYDKISSNISQFKRDNMLVWSVSDNENLGEFREVTRDFLSTIKNGIFPSYVMEMICGQTKVMDIYRNEPSKLNSIIQEEVRIVFNNKNYDIEDDEVFNSFEHIEIDETEEDKSFYSIKSFDEVLNEKETTKNKKENHQNQIVYHNEYVFTDNNFSDYRGLSIEYAVLMHNTKYENISGRQLLARVIESVIELNKPNLSKLLAEFNGDKGTNRIVPGNIAQKEFLYIKEYDISVFSKLSIDAIFRFIQRIFDLFEISHDNLIISLYK